MISCLGILSVNLKNHEERCFVFKTPGDQEARIAGNYEMLDEDLAADPITAVLFDYETEKVIWHSKQGAFEDQFAILDKGKFHLCFGNGAGGYKTEEDKHRQMMKLQGHPSPEDDDFDYTNHDGNNRRIGFSIHVHPMAGTEAHKLQQEKTESDEEKATKQTQKLTDMAVQLKERMEVLLDHQEYIKNRESTHRHVVEQTFTMVMRWTILEAMILISVASAQVFYLKRFFETKRYL